MRILVTNDDGIHAPGLKTMQDIAAALSKDVWVVAPETDQSGAAHSLTLQEPLRCRKIGEQTFAIRGTPTDCVIMAVRHLMRDGLPDLVLSGVNRGTNMGDDVTYSGTIAGAIEGTLLGIPSIALSLAVGFDTSGITKWETPMALGPSIITRLLDAGWPRGVLMNVNFPDCKTDDIAGLSVTTQGHRDQGLVHIDHRLDTRGDAYYWIGFERRKSNPAEGTDLWAIYGRRISVTPLFLNLTHDATRQELAAALGGSNIISELA